ncbi:hypothetical protein ACROYT_G000312 [Oculina patagonica]
MGTMRMRALSNRKDNVHPCGGKIGKRRKEVHQVKHPWENMDREVARKERKRSHKYIGMSYRYQEPIDLSENSDSELSEDEDHGTKWQRMQSPKKPHRDRYANPNRKVTTGARAAYGRHKMSKVLREFKATETSESSDSPENSDSCE